MYTTTYEILACNLDYKMTQSHKWPLWVRKLVLARIKKKAKKTLKGTELALLLELVRESE